jgi:hydroxymethylbilane synthase
MNKPTILGTRGSELALAQVELVFQALIPAVPDLLVEVKRITTTGDRRQDLRVGEVTGAGLKGLFTKEIQEALLTGQIDAAVHSAKDIPGQVPEGLAIAAVLPRADTSDVLIAKKKCSFADLPAGSRIATSSVRRRMNLLWMRPDLQVEEMRGNVPTRLNKLRESDSLDAIVLARAGLDRLEIKLDEFYVERLDTLPAIGQGAVALEIRADDAKTRSILEKINHKPTFIRLAAERELLRLLDGDCKLPVGADTELDGDRLKMKAIVFGEDGQPPRVGEAEGDASAPEALAARVFEQLGKA